MFGGLVKQATCIISQRSGSARRIGMLAVIACFACATIASDAIDTPGALGGSLTLTIQANKNTYVWGEPVGVRADLINQGPETVYIAVNGSVLSRIHGMESMLRWEVVDHEPQDPAVGIRHTMAQEIVVLLPGDELRFELQILVPPGATRFRLRYEQYEAASMGVPSRPIWSGVIRSNEIEINVMKAESLSAEEKERVDSAIDAYIEMLYGHDDLTRKAAASRLVVLGEHSFPKIVKLLDDQRAELRKIAAVCLMDMADPDLSQEADFTRITEGLPHLLRRLEQEYDPEVKRRIIFAFSSFIDLPEKEQELIVRALKEGIESRDPSVRDASATMLCRFAPEEAREVVGTMLQNKGGLSVESWLQVSREFSKLTGEEYSLKDYPGVVASPTVPSQKGKGRLTLVVQVALLATLVNAAVWGAIIMVLRRRHKAAKQ